MAADKSFQSSLVIPRHFNLLSDKYEKLWNTSEEPAQIDFCKSPIVLPSKNHQALGILQVSIYQSIYMISSATKHDVHSYVIWHLLQSGGNKHLHSYIY